MKIHTIKLAGIALATAIVLASCSGGMLGTGSTKSGAYIKVTVPGVAPWVLKAAPKSASKSVAPASRPASRAILEADAVNFTVTPQGSSTPAASWTEYPGYFASSTASNLTSTTTQALPLGSYKLTVDVFNNAVSTTTPVVSGMAPFSLAINGETIPVTVVCTPTNPPPLLPPPYTLSTQSLGQPWVFNPDGSLSSTGGEAWYKINTITGNVLVSMTPATNVVPLFGIIDSTGAIVGVSTLGVPDVGITQTMASSSIPPYYIGALDVSGLSSSAGFVSVSIATVATLATSITVIPSVNNNSYTFPQLYSASFAGTPTDQIVVWSVADSLGGAATFAVIDPSTGNLTWTGDVTPQESETVIVTATATDGSGVSDSLSVPIQNWAP